MKIRNILLSIILVQLPILSMALSVSYLVEYTLQYYLPDGWCILQLNNMEQMKSLRFNIVRYVGKAFINGLLPYESLPF